MKLYRIYTEDKNRAEILDRVSDYFPAFTVLEATGFWRGTKESSLVLEILTKDGPTVYTVANYIKAHNAQQAVLVVSFEVDSDLV